MNCCFTACELWKLARRGYVPMDIYNARSTFEGCGCGCGNFANEVSSGCGCVENGCCENNYYNGCNCN